MPKYSGVFKNLQQLQHIDFYNNPKLLALSYHHSPLSAALWYQRPFIFFRKITKANNILPGTIYCQLQYIASYNMLAGTIYCQVQYIGRYMPKDNFTNLGLGSNEMFSVSCTFLFFPHMSSHSCYAPLRRPYENWPKVARQQKPICSITDLFIPALFL